MNPGNPHAYFPSAAVAIIRRLRTAGHQAVFAGGCVRDFVLGVPAKDFDIATSARPEEVQRLFHRVTDMQGKVFGVVRVIEQNQAFEVATFRTDGNYADGRRPETVQFSGPEEDARRRDFTINGMFFDPLNGQILDYVGGQADLRGRLVRAIGTPVLRFQEDHLRLFRAIRFACHLGFAVEKETWRALKQTSHLATHLAPERVRDELDRCLTGPDPARALGLCLASDLLRPWIPEIAQMDRVEQPKQYHPEGDVLRHVLLMLGMLSCPPSDLAWSVLLHDIAKPVTQTVDATGRIRFNGHESKGAIMAAEILRRLRFPNELIQRVEAAVANHMAFKDVPKMRLSTLKRFLARSTFDLELELHRIDCSCSHGKLDLYQFLLEKKRELPPTEISPPRLVNGRDLMAMGLVAGPELGQLLNQLRDEQLEGLLQTREQALQRAEELLRDRGVPTPTSSPPAGGD